MPDGLQRFALVPVCAAAVCLVAALPSHVCAQVPDVGPGRCYGNCPSSPAPTPTNRGPTYRTYTSPAPAYVPSVSRDERAQAAFDLGKTFFNSGQYAKAETEFWKAIGHWYKDPNLRGWVAQALERQGKCSAAIHQYKTQLKLDPGNAAAQANIGHCYQVLGDRTKALAAYDTALGFEHVTGDVKASIDSWMADINRQLAAEQNERERKVAVERTRSEAAARSARTSDFEAALKSKDVNKAIAAARALDPRDAAALAESRMRDGRLEEGKIAFAALVAATSPDKRLEAINQFRNAILTFSKDPADYVEVQRAYIAALPPGVGEQKAVEQVKLGFALMQAGQHPAATAEFQNALAQSRDPVFLAKMGDALRQSLGENGVASLFYERALKLDPANRAAAQGLAATRGLAAGSPGRSPREVAAHAPAVSEGSALGQAKAIAGALSMFDQNMAAGSPGPLRVLTMPHQTAPQVTPPVPERYSNNRLWQQLRGNEDVARAARDQAQHALEDAQLKLGSLDPALPGEAAKVQAEITKQRAEVAKATEQLNKVQDDKKKLEYVLDQDEGSVSPPPEKRN